MPIGLYLNKGKAFGVLQKSTRNLPIMASRGCPSHCTFCQRFMGSEFRIRSAENIFEELVHWKQIYQVREFSFLDDNFTFDKKTVMALCERIIKNDLKILFSFPNGVREDFLDEEILDALKSAGCYHLDFGIESGSQKVLNLIKKGKTLNRIAEKVRLCHKKGFKLSASFLFGFPGETLADMKETIKFAISLPLDTATFGIVIPFPGTEIRQEAIQGGYLIERSYEYYNPTRADFLPLMQTPDWTAHDLQQMTMQAQRSFYMRPLRILRSLPLLCRISNVKAALRLLKKYSLNQKEGNYEKNNLYW